MRFSSYAPRVLLWTAACAAVTALGGCVPFNGCRKSPEPPAPPAPAVTTTSPRIDYTGYNLVFVSFDALQGAHVGCLGYQRDVTPTLDSIAARGYNFRRAFSVASWTVPASMTWFTGVYPTEHRLTNKYAEYEPPHEKLANLKELSPELVTLAEVLRAEGYATVGFTGNAGVSGGFGYEQGFDRYVHEPQKFGGLNHSIPEAVRWLRENRDRKFFLFLHGYDAHGQNTPTEGFDYRFVDPAYDGRYSGSELEQELLREEGLDRGELTLREADVRFWRAVYDEKIQRADERFADFLAELERLGLVENTLLVITSDHGTEFYEHRRFDHGFTLYNEQLHVPLVIRLPGQTTGREIDAHISSIDLMPTLLELLGVPQGESLRRQLRGQSLVPLMLGENVEKYVFAETDYRLFTFKRCIISPDNWKLIYTLEDDTRELYNLTADPGETRNLAAEHPERADLLQDRLFAHYRALGHPLDARRWTTGYNPVYNFPTPNASRD